MTIPLVAVEGGPPGEIPVVEVDQLAGAHSATRHLLDLGHATVWHIAGPAEFLEAERRLEGWRATLTAAGAEVPSPLSGDWSARSGYDLGRRLAADRAATAIFVANDQMALGVLRALHEADRSVPGEVSVVGFDDIPEAAVLLASADHSPAGLDELGRRSLRLMLCDRGRRSSRGRTRRPGVGRARQHRGAGRRVSARRRRG